MPTPELSPRILVRLDAALERRVVRAMHWAFWLGVCGGVSAMALALLGLWLGQRLWP